MFSALSMLTVLAVGVELGACANAESSSAPGVSERVPEGESADGGVPSRDASIDVDADADTDPCVAEAFCPIALFGASDAGTELDVRTRIDIIRGRSASDVWAGGAAGAMAHFNGSAWKVSETLTTGSVRALWLRETGELAWMSISPASTLARGIDLEPAGAPKVSADGWLSAKDVAVPGTLSSGLTAAWSTLDAEWLWGTTSTPAAGQNGLWRARIDTAGRTLEIQDPLAAGACTKLGCWWMQAVHGATSDDLWAVGRSGTTLHVTGAQGAAPTITAIDSRTWAFLSGVWASGSEMFAVGAAGTIRHYPGTGDSLDIVSELPLSENLNAVWGTSPNDVWAVGDASCVIHWDGSHWSRVSVGGLGSRRPDLYTVWTATPGKVWIGGDGVLLTLGGEP